MKFAAPEVLKGVAKSSSTRRTWIEIPLPPQIAAGFQRSSSTRRTWIEMHKQGSLFGGVECRPPHGGRGLKFGQCYGHIRCGQSSSTRRTWIEMEDCWVLWLLRPCRPPHGGRGLKFSFTCLSLVSRSRPPHGGRGLKSVCCPPGRSRFLSSSTRRTWIEMSSTSPVSGSMQGRPPHGGRGLKFQVLIQRERSLESSSTRRTWIEIAGRCCTMRPGPVVLHTEDVD